MRTPTFGTTDDLNCTATRVSSTLERLRGVGAQRQYVRDAGPERSPAREGSETRTPAHRVRASTHLGESVSAEGYALRGCAVSSECNTWYARVDERSGGSNAP